MWRLGTTGAHLVNSLNKCTRVCRSYIVKGCGGSRLGRENGVFRVCAWRVHKRRARSVSRSCQQEDHTTMRCYSSPIVAMAFLLGLASCRTAELPQFGPTDRTGHGAVPSVRTRSQSPHTVVATGSQPKFQVDVAERQGTQVVSPQKKAAGVSVAGTPPINSDVPPFPRPSASPSFPCTESRAIVDEDHADTSTTNIPSALVTDAVLRPGLVVRIDVHVLGKKEIEEQARRISDQGEITLPLLGVVNVVGKTVDELAANLKRDYSRYLVNPQVVVEFVTDKNAGGAMPWGYVTVLGRVKKPGRVYIPATRDLTLSAAIQEAGGLDGSAKDTAIRLTRVGPDGVPTTRELNLRAVGVRGEAGGDIALQAGDIAYIPELMF